MASKREGLANNSMKSDQDGGFEAIWPGVRAEIESARHRRVNQRRAVRIGGSLALLMAVAGLGVIGLQSLTPHARAFNPWQLQDISSETGISADYPLALGKRIFVVHGHGDHQNIACVEKRSGAITWTNGLSFSRCRLAADEQRVYLLANANGGHWVCAALDARTGSTLWSQPASESLAGLPSTLTMLRDGLCWSEGNRVVLREAATGKLVWNTTIGSGGLLSAPVPREGVLLAASSDGFHALSPRTGEILWSQPLPGSSAVARFTRPMLEAGGDRLFCASRSSGGKGVLWCIDTGTKKVLWTRETEVPVKLHLHGERVFVRSLNLDAFDARTGQALWQAPVGGCGTLSFHGDRVYLVDAAEHSRVLALDSATGHRVWTHAVAGSCNGVVVSDRVGFLSGNDRTLYAFALNEES